MPEVYGTMPTPARTLATYLAETGLSHRALGEKAGVDFTTINKVLNGHRRRFSPTAAKRLHKINRRKLPLEDLLGLGDE
jgi:transcriptional regulator with XRE-family HTH domain